MKNETAIIIIAFYIAVEPIESFLKEIYHHVSIIKIVLQSGCKWHDQRRGWSMEVEKLLQEFADEKENNRGCA